MDALETFRATAGLLKLLRSQWLDTSAHRQRQNRALEAQLRYAATNVPFYRTSWDGCGIDRSAPQQLEHFKRLPILHRRTIQAQPDAFLAEGRDRARWHHSRTSGSTGRPLETWFDRSSWGLVKYAVKGRRLLASGWRPGHRVTIVEACTPDLLSQYARTQRLPGERCSHGRSYLSVFDPPEQSVRRLLELAPHFLYGFPSYFAELAKSWEPSLAASVPLKALMTSGEWMHPTLRTRLQQVFGVPVLDVYGSTEFKEIAWQCPIGSGYHINMESLIVEIVDGRGRSVGPGEVGDVVVTSLTNRAMPLVRYATGDRARRLDGPCPCGRGLERLDRIEGRVADYLHLGQSIVVSPYELTTAIEEFSEVLEYKVTQVLANRVRVAVALSPRTNPKVLPTIQTALSTKLGHRLEVEVVSVDSIPRESSGKRRVVETIWTPK